MSIVARVPGAAQHETMRCRTGTAKALKPHDVMALVPIIAGAGGIMTTWENGPPQHGGRIVAAGDRRVHAEALKLLNS